MVYKGLGVNAHAHTENKEEENMPRTTKSGINDSLKTEQRQA